MVVRASVQHDQARLDRHGRGQDVANGRGVLDVLTQLLELLRCGVRRAHPALGANRREAGVRTAEPEEPMQVKVALDLVAELLDLDAPGGSVVGVADRIAERECLQDQLDGVRTSIRAEEGWWLVADQLERLGSLGRRGASVLECADLLGCGPRSPTCCALGR